MLDAVFGVRMAYISLFIIKGVPDWSVPTRLVPRSVLPGGGIFYSV